MGTSHTKFKKAHQETCLKLLANGETVTDAAKKVGITTRTVHYFRKANPDWNEKYRVAFEIGTCQLEDELMVRAKKSDVLLMFLLKSRRPEIYRDNYQVTVKGHIDVSHRPDLSLLSTKELTELQNIGKRLVAKPAEDVVEGEVIA